MIYTQEREQDKYTLHRQGTNTLEPVLIPICNYHLPGAGLVL